MRWFFSGRARVAKTFSCNVSLGYRGKVRPSIDLSYFDSHLMPSPSPLTRSTLLTLQPCGFFSTHESSANSTPFSSVKQFESPWSKMEKSYTIDVEIISSEKIKPSSPTPHHLRSYKLSSIDQLLLSGHIPFIFFYPNNENMKNHSGVISDRLKYLKHSLSETLTRFYPFSGMIKNNFSIDCNDEGIYYVEATVNSRLSDFLSQPHTHLIHRLIPDDPVSTESALGTHVFMVQVNIFDCGGIAICTSASHKIIDGSTYVTFLKAWSDTTRGSSKVISPCFVAPTLFLQNDSLSSVYLPNLSKETFVTKRFVFDASALATLKTKASSFVTNPSRVEVVSGLIWKCTTAASLETYSSRNKSSFLSMAVNLRKKSSPPLPEESIGNITWFAVARCMSDSDLGLACLVGRIRNAMEEIDGDFVEQIKGEKGYLNMIRRLKSLGDSLKEGEFNYYSMTSLCNSGFYEIDFGWGRPMWIFACNPGINNQIVLVDTRLGGGIEAWVTLSEEDMAAFELDPLILEFSSSDPNPLELCNPSSHPCT